MSLLYRDLIFIVFSFSSYADLWLTCRLVCTWWKGVAEEVIVRHVRDLKRIGISYQDVEIGRFELESCGRVANMADGPIIARFKPPLDSSPPTFLTLSRDFFNCESFKMLVHKSPVKCDDSCVFDEPMCFFDLGDRASRLCFWDWEMEVSIQHLDFDFDGDPLDPVGEELRKSAEYNSIPDGVLFVADWEVVDHWDSGSIINKYLCDVHAKVTVSSVSCTMPLLIIGMMNDNGLSIRASDKRTLYPCIMADNVDCINNAMDQICAEYGHDFLNTDSVMNDTDVIRWIIGMNGHEDPADEEIWKFKRKEIASFASTVDLQSYWKFIMDKRLRGTEEYLHGKLEAIMNRRSNIRGRKRKRK